MPLTHMEVARGMKESWVVHAYWMLQLVVGVLAVVPAANSACKGGGKD